MTVQTKAQKGEHLQNFMAQGRKAKLERIARKASDRRNRRAKAVNKLWEGRPEPPTGLLARFKWGAYEKSFNQWEESRGGSR